MMASRALAACTKSPDDYYRVYTKLLRQAKEPVIIHWLGEMFDPALAGYWGYADHYKAMEVALTVIKANAAKVDGVKVSLLDKQKEVDMRRRLPAGRAHVHRRRLQLRRADRRRRRGLLGRAARHLRRDRAGGVGGAVGARRGDRARFHEILAPTVPLSRHIFGAPTRFYKTGVVFLAWLNGHQDHFVMVGGQQSARSILHLADVFRLADRAGLLRDPELAVRAHARAARGPRHRRLKGRADARSSRSCRARPRSSARWALRDALVGRSHECDFPPGVERAAGAVRAEGADPRREPRRSTARCARLVADGLSVYRVDAEALRALAPDVIVTQTQCEVCAVSEADVVAATCDWAGSGVRIVSLAPSAARRRVRRHRARRRGARRARRAARRSSRACASGSPRSPRARASSRGRAIACIEWLDPLMAAGNWVPELVELAGGRNLFGAVGEHSPWLEWEAVRAADPDVIVAMPCGFDLARTRARDGGARAAAAAGTPCARSARARVCVVDGHQYFNRPGRGSSSRPRSSPRSCIPGSFDFGHGERAGRHTKR